MCKTFELADIVYDRKFYDKIWFTDESIITAELGSTGRFGEFCFDAEEAKSKQFI